MNKTIEELYLAVYATNCDPGIIENDETAEQVQSLLNESTVAEITNKEDFLIACAKLDFSESVPPRKIHYFQNHANPNDSGYICFAEDYGD
jgi:hypothetical protein